VRLIPKCPKILI